jgi:Uroporphyrinogen decarboxylase (URO-D)
MNRRQRLMASIRGERVDRPPVSFYEINGLDERPDDNDPFNIFNHPSWRPLIELAREKSDRIVMRAVPFSGVIDPVQEGSTVESWQDEQGRLFTRRSLRARKRTLTSLTRRDPQVNTIWTVEHLLKDVDDLQAYLELPLPIEVGKPEIDGVLQAEQALGDSGIVMIDTSDPLCEAAQLFPMADYTVIALSEQALFQRLLERFAVTISARTEAVAQALPGRLWRIYGPEYASPPYLPPRLFHEYVVRYDKPMVESIQRWGGYARIHSHGRLRLILDEIAATGCDGLDPIEPPPQGDMTLREVRRKVGQQMTLFGNLEASDIENLPTREFREKVIRALEQGTEGEGRGFVLMPSACPYGREVSKLALANYGCMVQEAGEF